MRLLHAHGLAPKVYVAFRNGICYGYLEGKVIPPASIEYDMINLL